MIIIKSIVVSASVKLELKWDLYIEVFVKHFIVDIRGITF